MKILVIRLSAIGDVIHCLPVAAALKRRFPEAEISWLVEAGSADLVVNNPAIDRVFIFRGKQWLKGLPNPANWGATAAEAKKFFLDFGGHGFDVVLNLHGVLKGALLAVASRAPLRLGFKGVKEFSEAFMTHRLNVGDYFGHGTHVVDVNLMMVDYLLRVLGLPREQAGAPVEFPLPEPAQEQVQRVKDLLKPLTEMGEPASVSQPAVVPEPGAVPQPVAVSEPGAVSQPGPIPQPWAASELPVVLIPGTTWLSKIWPGEKWCELAVLLAQRLGKRLIIVGGKGESATNAGIVQGVVEKYPQARILDLTGKTSLLELIALFRQSGLVIGVDTGPLHLAAAVGKPKVVAIHGSTPTKRNGPYGTQCHTIAMGLSCQPCFEKNCPLGTTACLKDLQPDRVFNDIKMFLGS